MTEARASDVMIVRVAMPNRSVVRFQGILAGEDGLATLRSQGGEAGEHDLWTTRAQLHELEAWLASLPGPLEVRVIGRYAFQPDAGEYPVTGREGT